MESSKARHDNRYLIANWKCNKSLEQALRWIDDFTGMHTDDARLDILLAPPMIWLAQCAEHLAKKNITSIKLCAQDISSFPSGSYTGAVSADMLNDLVTFSIIGHSERRRYFHETSQDVTNKAAEALDAGITPIVCVDKTYAMSQLTALNGIEGDDFIIAYTPTDDRAYRDPEPADIVEEAVRFISGISPNHPVIYGGAITGRNARDYSRIAGVSGLFVGSGSLDPASFHQICLAAAS